MKRLLLAGLLLLAAEAFAKPPKLTLFISVDSMGTDIFQRMKPRLKSGLSQLSSQGAFFPALRYEYAEAVTAAGHATLSTGANPWRHGIVGNRILNRQTGKEDSILSDPNHPVLEAPPGKDDVSPENLIAETLSDKVRLFTQARGKAVAVAGKARAAIAMGGHLGQAWWFHEGVGKFVTGTYYTKEFPAWVKGFNEKNVPASFFGKDWALSAPEKDYVGQDDRPFESDWYAMGRTFPHKMTGGLPSPGPQFYSALTCTPYLNDLIVQFAKAAIDGEQLGKDDVPDLLSVSFSATDRVYHLYGPYSWEAQDAMLRLDKAIGELVAAAEKAAGKGNVLVVLSADHGGAAVSEEWAEAGLPSTRLNPATLQQGLGKELQAHFGQADLVSDIEETDLYLNQKSIADHKLDGASVRRAAAQWLLQQPDVEVAVAADDLAVQTEMMGFLKALRRGYYPGRSGDVLFLLKPWRILTDEPAGTSHGTPYSYDAQVPLILWGKGVKAGVYAEEHPVTDVAPTVATLLEMGAPAMAEGKPIAEALSSGK
ncbi:MAG: alkaline phosphatase family protein [Myxococcaceae bacterium]